MSFRAFFFVLLWVPLLSSCHVGRFFIWNFADHDDFKKFQNAKIEADPALEFKFKKSDVLLDSLKKLKVTADDEKIPFEEYIQTDKTLAFLIIRNDTILYENYFRKAKDTDFVTSFSVAKSYVSALVGIAVAEGHISSVHDPIIKYLPSLDSAEFADVTIEHILNMRSGLKYNEGYFNPFGHVAKFYYGRNLAKYVSKLKTDKAPDTEFDYTSGNTQLLAMALENAVGKPVEEYLSEKIWKPLGMESDASWSIDSKKKAQAKAFCCINARARDFAKFGRLFLNNGQWEGKQIIPKEWTEASRNGIPENNYRYAYQWWHNNNYFVHSNDIKKKEYRMTGWKDKQGRKIAAEPLDDFYAQGLLGQYIYVHPPTNTIIVRFGEKQKDVNWPGFMRSLALAASGFGKR